MTPGDWLPRLGDWLLSTVKRRRALGTPFRRPLPDRLDTDIGGTPWPPWPSALALFASVCALTALNGCKRAPVDPRTQVLQVIGAAEAAAEAKDIDGVLTHLTETFRDGQGGDARELRSMMQLHFLRQGSIHALVRPGELRFPTPDTAEMDLDVAVAGTPLPEGAGNTFDLSGVRADWIDLQLSLVRRDDTWKIERASWSRAGLMQ